MNEDENSRAEESRPGIDALRGTNPYDFRNPVTEPSLLAGRKAELAEVRRHLRTAAAGRPVHIALIGNRAAGKTSLLRVIEREASDFRLLAVRLDLDEGLVASVATFFKALFEGVVQALVDAGALEESDPRYGAWLRQVHLGDQTVPPSEQLIMFGMVAASLLNGVEHADIAPSLLARDCNALSDLARASGFKGIVILCDEGDLIGGNPALIQKLRNLLQSVQQWMLVAAGTRAMFDRLTDVFSPIPRQFVRLGVEPFREPGEVYSCITTPLGRRNIRIPISIETIFDLFSITGGSPYEINLVSYYIWRELEAGRQHAFELSTRVFDAVLGEIREFGRQVATEDVEAIRNLTEDDLAVASRVIPFENYTAREIALSRLLPNDFSAEEFESKLREVESDIRRLEVLGLVAVEDEYRFSFLGDVFARTYFKYSAKRRGSVGYSWPSYAQHVAAEILSAARAKLLGDSVRGLGSAEREFSIDDSSAGAQLLVVGDAMKKRAIEQIAESPYGFLLGKEELEGDEVEDLLFLGFTFLVDRLTPVETGEILINTPHVAPEDWPTQVESWVEENRELLGKYGVELTLCVTGTLDREASRELFALGELDDAETRGLQQYAARQYAESCETMKRGVEALTGAVGGSPHLASLRDRLATVLNRLGFVAAVAGELDTAESALRGALELESGSTEAQWLPYYNLAYIAAKRGAWDTAAELARQAEASLKRTAEVEPDTQVFFMLVATPTPSDWEEQPGWNIFEVPGTEIRRFVHIQAHAYAELSGSGDLASCTRLVERVGDDSSPALHRLAGWVKLTVLNDPAGSVAHFTLSRNHPGTGKVCEDELNYALSRLEVVQEV